MKIFEFISKDHSHNQYLYGVIRKYKKDIEKIYVPTGCLIKDYAENVALDKINFKIEYCTKINLYLNFFFSFIFRNKIIISGASTYLIILCSIISFYNRLDVHLHGQFYGAKKNKFKRYIWILISKLLNLQLCCLFYRDSIKVVNDPKILFLDTKSKILVNKKKKSNIVGIISGKGRYKSKGLNEKNRLKKRGYKLLYYKKSKDPQKEWVNYLEFLNKIDFLFLNPVNEYNHYSPSGTIFDSYNYNINMISFKKNYYVTKLVRLGCKNIILIN